MQFESVGVVNGPLVFGEADKARPGFFNKFGCVVTNVPKPLNDHGFAG